jgi:hypothetical protein
MGQQPNYVGWEGVSAVERKDELPEILQTATRENSPMVSIPFLILSHPCLLLIL